jgi:outer membrane protein assembly factor BamD (BamD/ComL family)
MRRFSLALTFGITLSLASLAAGSRSLAWFADAPPQVAELPSATAVTKPVIPDWPGEIVGLLLEKKYAEARAAIARLETTKPPKDADTRAFYDLVRAAALRLEGKNQDAITLVENRLKQDPKSSWTTKLRGELAAASLAAGKQAQAQTIVRADAELLLGGPRKDALAEIYRGFAKRLSDPVETLVAPDYAGARSYLNLAREVAQSRTLRDDLTLQIAQAALDQGVPHEAVPELENLAANEPRKDRKQFAKFMLGLAIFRSGDHPRARREWNDLARSLEADAAKDAALKSLHSDCLYAVALATGLPFEWELEKNDRKAATPVPGIDHGPNGTRAIAAGRKAIAAAPADSRAVRTAFAIGAMLENRPAEALEYWQTFLKDRAFKVESEIARKDLAKFEPIALLKYATAARQLEKFDEAQDAFREYAAKYPDGSDSAASLQAVIDIELDRAGALRRAKKEAEYREAIRKFVAANPLQPSVPALLKQVGESFEREKKYAEAVDAWKILAARYPDHGEADHGRFLIGSTYENKLGDPNLAIETYRGVRQEPWKSQANMRIHLMENKSLAVITPRIYRSGETAALKVSTRNIEKLVFSAYRIDPESYFRKKQRLSAVESLDIGLVKPDAEWTAEVPGQARYKPVDHEYTMPKVELPGVWVVKVTDDKALQATTMVIGSDLDAIVKASRDQLLVFVQDMSKGQPKPAARVLVSDGTNVIVDDKTGADGVLLRDWPGARSPGANQRLLVIEGSHVATTDSADIPAESARGLSAKGMILTDRPAYEPGDSVKLRGIIREVTRSRFETREGAVYTLEVVDSNGRRIDSRPVTVSKFGTFSAEIPIDTAAPLGEYSVRVFQPEGSTFTGKFAVETYELPKVVLNLNLDKPIVERGEKLKGKVIARYSYGTPLASRNVRLILPSGRTQDLTTDAAGQAGFEFETEDLDENGSYSVIAQLPEEGLSASTLFAIPGASFSASLSTARSTYLADETIPVRISTNDALDKPTGQSLTLTVARRSNEDGRTIETEVSKTTVKTDTTTGKAIANVKVEDKRGGIHILRLTGTDSFGRPVTAESIVNVSGIEDPNGLRLLADTTTWKLGTEASANLYARHSGGLVLVCFEADRMLGYRVEKVNEGDNRLTWKVADDHFPNLTVSATRMRDRNRDAARLDITVDRGLKLTLKPKSGQVKPGEPVEADLIATDQNDKPAVAEISLALVDKALLRLFSGDEFRPNLSKSFYDQTRLGAFGTVSTNTFEYRPATIPVPESLVDEAERQNAQVANEAGRDQARNLAMYAAQPQPGAGGMAGKTQAPVAPAPASSMGMQADGQAFGTPGMTFRSDPRQTGGRRGRADNAPRSEAISRKLAEKSESKENDDRELGKPAAGDFIVGMRVTDQAALGVMGGMGGGMGGMGGGMGASPRQRAIETAFWNASIITDEAGKAIVKFEAPNALGEYEFAAYGVTVADTLLGQTTADLDVRKPFFVELILPSHLSEGDKIRPLARLHHTGIKGEVNVILERYQDGHTTREPKTVKVDADGVTPIMFDEFEVPATREVRFDASAQSGETSDRETVTVPAEPWGTPVLASEHGSGRDDTTVFVELPAVRTYENLAMMVSISPTLQRQVLEAALGAEVWPMPRDRWTCVLPPVGDTTSDRAADLLSATSALTYLRQIGGASTAIDQSRLVDRIRGLVAELTTRQNGDGGWPIVAPGPIRLQSVRNPQQAISVPSVSAKVVIALAQAKAAGVVDPGESLEKGATYVASTGDAARPWKSLALALTGKTGFEELNALHRVRQSLDSVEVAALVLAWLKIDRRSLADEAMTTLITRSRTVPAQPGKPIRRFWPAGVAGEEITTGWATWALASVRPGDEALPESVAWLMSRRFGPGWIPYETKGAAVAALSAWHGRAQGSDDRYRMTVTVNDKPIETFAVDGAAGSPVRVWNIPPDVVRKGRNTVRFDVEGRANFGYGVQLSGFSRDYGPEQKPEGKSHTIASREWLAAEPEFEGILLPTGFSSVINPKEFRNRVTQIPVGGRARLSLSVDSIPNRIRRDTLEEPVIVEETLPSGARLVEGSVTGDILRTEQDRGKIRFYLQPNRFGRTTISYEIFGAFEGRSKIRPARVYQFSHAEQAHASKDAELSFLPSGSKTTDPYEPTPDELFARGQRLFEKGRIEESAAPLEALSTKYTINDGVARETARMLLDAHIASKKPGKIVEDFEILKSKAPDLVIPTEKIKAVGDAYVAIGEHERALLVWRAMIDSGYLEDAQLAQTLRRTDRPLEAAAYLLDLWKSYPNSAGRQSDFFGLSRWLAQLADESNTDAATRRRLLAANVTRSHLLAQSVALTQLFLTLTPDDPLADEANLAILGDLSSLDADESVVKVAQRAARLYPKSRFLDSFQFSEALARFDLGQMDEAVAIARKISETVYEEPGGVKRPSPNKNQAIYIMAQIFDARADFPQAIDRYKQVSQEFPDAAVAIKALERKHLSLPEVTVVPTTSDGGAVKAKIEVSHRNVGAIELKIYPVDLLRLYLSKRTLDKIDAVDLAGIRPLKESKETLSSGKDFKDGKREISVDLPGEGAYLVMTRGDDLFASGIVLATPIDLKVMEDPASGRVRVEAREAGTSKPMSNLQVKLSATNSAGFRDGSTDLRGVFVQDGLQGLVTVVVRQSAGRFAFYRGKIPLGGSIVQGFSPASPPQTPALNTSGGVEAGQSLNSNLLFESKQNVQRQMERLEQRFDNNNRSRGVKIDEVK